MHTEYYVYVNKYYFTFTTWSYVWNKFYLHHNYLHIQKSFIKKGRSMPPLWSPLGDTREPNNSFSLITCNVISFACNIISFIRNIIALEYNNKSHSEYWKLENIWWKKKYTYICQINLYLSLFQLNVYIRCEITITNGICCLLDLFDAFIKLFKVYKFNFQYMPW